MDSQNLEVWGVFGVDGEPITNGYYMKYNCKSTETGHVTYVEGLYLKGKLYRRLGKVYKSNPLKVADALNRKLTEVERGRVLM